MITIFSDEGDLLVDGSKLEGGELAEVVWEAILQSEERRINAETIKYAFYQADWTAEISEYEDQLRQELRLPEHWCGTAFCFAGWTALIKSPGQIVTPAAIATRAELFLGLNTEEAGRLFAGGNRLEEIYDYLRARFPAHTFRPIPGDVMADRVDES